MHDTKEFEAQEFLVEPQVERLRNTILSDQILHQNRIEMPRAIDQSAAEFRQPISAQQSLQQSIGEVAAARDERSLCRVRAFQPRGATTRARASSPSTESALLPQNCYKRRWIRQSSTDRWTYHYGKFHKGREPFGVIVKEILQKAQIKDIPPIPPALCPWKQPATQDRPRLLSSAKLKVKKKILEQWQEAWDYCHTGDFYRGINPTVRYKVKFHTTPRAKDVQITRLRLGRVKLRTTLHSIRKAEDPNCEACGVPEDIEHFLKECPNQSQLQNLLRRNCRRHQLKFSIKTALKEASCINAIYDYFTENNIWL